MPSNINITKKLFSKEIIIIGIFSSLALILASLISIWIALQSNISFEPLKALKFLTQLSVFPLLILAVATIISKIKTASFVPSLLWWNLSLAIGYIAGYVFAFNDIRYKLDGQAIFHIFIIVSLLIFSLWKHYLSRSLKASLKLIEFIPYHSSLPFILLFLVCVATATYLRIIDMHRVARVVSLLEYFFISMAVIKGFILYFKKARLKFNTILLLFIIIVGAFLLRYIDIQRFPFNVDEANFLNIAYSNTYTSFFTFKNFSYVPHAALHQLIIKFLRYRLNNNLLTVRFDSIILGSLMAIFFFLGFKIITNSTIPSIVGTLLICVHPFLVSYGRMGWTQISATSIYSLYFLCNIYIYT